ncbi:MULTISPECIES: oligopeptide ABC transporter permease [Niallia]|uniref:Peptide ABC transporter permease n=1 Tax=Niallia circulans TaxID=1397 RepID=A0A268FF86_NIACI|nr:oligopeptide ABC transporter permease [Niallia circulans]AYV68567.1 ABC transporter permease [Niallia circulans]AYV73040.1 ABC transporter permease [Niallia circulans]PAD84034.1 peptide ABC transporter permease [Niallia circulans]QJX64474.1 ABC transporter permease [Niallia circulans]
MDKNNLKNIDKNLFKPLKQEESISERITAPSRTFGQDARRTLFKNKPAIISIFVILLIIVLSIFGPYFTGYDSNGQDLSRAKLPPRVPVLEKVSWLGLDGTLSGTYKGVSVEDATNKAYARYKSDKEFIDIKVLDEGNGERNSASVKATFHIYEQRKLDDTYFWFGTDTLGRDQWTRLWEGTRVSLIIAFVAAALDLLIGVAYGGISGFYGGRVDNVLQRIAEVLVGIPNLVIILLMMLILKPGIISIVVALTITGWIGMSRVVRGEVMKLTNQEFVLAAKTLGTSNGTIIRKHLIPNISGIIIVNTMFSIPGAIFFEAFLSFIGLGIVPPDASLGALIELGFANLRLYPYLLVFPAVVLSVLMIAFNILGDGLRDAFDPKMHK